MSVSHRKSAVIGFTLLLFCGGTAGAQKAPLDLFILPNGHVRIDNGPELDISQLQARIAAFKRQRPQPNLAPRSDSQTQYGAVMVVIQTFQDSGYGDHIVFPGADKEK